MQVFKSRFTPNATGDEVKLEKGEMVECITPDKKLISIIIQSAQMSHPECANLGYEVMRLDNRHRFFADGKLITNWAGKSTKP